MTEIEPTQTAPTRLQADSRPVIVGVTWAVSVLAMFSFVAGVPGLVAVGRWAQLPGPMAYLVPLLLDLGLAIFAMVATVRRGRGESATFAWSALVTLTLASMGAQVAHVVSEPAAAPWHAIAGALLASSFPAIVFASTHSILDLAIAPAPAKRNARRTKPTSKVAAAPVAARKRPVSQGPEVASSAPLRAVRTPNMGVPVVVDEDRQALRGQVLALRADGKSFSQVSEATGVSASTAKRWAKAA